jgi:hypothetical protein
MRWTQIAQPPPPTQPGGCCDRAQGPHTCTWQPPLSHQTAQCRWHWPGLARSETRSRPPGLRDPGSTAERWHRRPGTPAPRQALAREPRRWLPGEGEGVRSGRSRGTGEGGGWGGGGGQRRTRRVWRTYRCAARPRRRRIPPPSPRKRHERSSNRHSLRSQRSLHSLNSRRSIRSSSALTAEAGAVAVLDKHQGPVVVVWVDRRVTAQHTPRCHCWGVVFGGTANAARPLGTVGNGAVSGLVEAPAATLQKQNPPGWRTCTHAHA